jgi:hypothetical protein
MAAESKKEIRLEIAHVLFIDIVGHSKRLETAPFLGPAPRRSALRKNRRVARAKGTAHVEER